MARTQFNAWQFPDLEGSGAMHYVDVKHTTIAHPANGIVTYKVEFPDKIEGINIKTIRVISDENVPFIVRLLDGATDIPIYESLEELKFQYDNVDIPYKPKEKALYVQIFNKGNILNKFHIDIRGIEVK